MTSRLTQTLLASAAMLILQACGEAARLPLSAGVGTHPTIPAPERTLIPTVNIAPAKGWPPGARPLAGDGMSVEVFASGLDHPRWLYVLPNGDVLVAESNAPYRPDDARGFRGWVASHVMAGAGLTGPSANRITLLRATGRTGRAVSRFVFLDRLNSPFGMVLVGNDFYVADTDALLRFRYAAGETHIGQPGEKVTDLPAGSLNHHWTRNVIASGDGTQLFVTVGSNSNAAENGLEQETGRAAIWEIETATGLRRVFASGLRNPNGLAWEPDTGTLWTVVNERDELGSDLVPDYLTSVRAGAFYGWPYSYYGSHVDERVSPQRPDLVARAVVPDYAVGSHTASIGLAFSAGPTGPGQPADQSSGVFPRGMFVGQHGSWNRRPRSGYRVILVPFSGGRPAGAPIDVLDGFVDKQGRAQGRPVGVVLDRQGALLVADDVGNTIWRVTAARMTAAEPK